jgi:hypothetical protein
MRNLILAVAVTLIFCAPAFAGMCNWAGYDWNLKLEGSNIGLTNNNEDGGLYFSSAKGSGYAFYLSDGGFDSLLDEFQVTAGYSYNNRDALKANSMGLFLGLYSRDDEINQLIWGAGPGNSAKTEGYMQVRLLNAVPEYSGFDKAYFAKDGQIRLSYSPAAKLLGIYSWDADNLLDPWHNQIAGFSLDNWSSGSPGNIGIAIGGWSATGNIGAEEYAFWKDINISSQPLEQEKIAAVPEPGGCILMALAAGLGLSAKIRLRKIRVNQRADV